MQILEEFLRDKELPVKIETGLSYCGLPCEIVYRRGHSYYGHVIDRKTGEPGASISLGAHAPDEFQLYVEPQKLVPWYQWRWRYKKNPLRWCLTDFYKTEEDMRDNASDADGFEYFRDDESMRLWPE